MGFWFPPEGSNNDPAWWKPLGDVAALTQASESLHAIAMCEFMFMGRADSRRRRIWTYKHVATRRYINIDDAGHTYRYVAPADLDKPGRYVAHRRLQDALDDLDLDIVLTSARYERCRGCDVCGSVIFRFSEDGEIVF